MLSRPHLFPLAQRGWFSAVGQIAFRRPVLRPDRDLLPPLQHPFQTRGNPGKDAGVDRLIRPGR